MSVRFKSASKLSDCRIGKVVKKVCLLLQAGTLSWDVMLHIYKTLVMTQLEQCVLFWPPHCRKAVIMLQKPRCYLDWRTVVTGRDWIG